MSRACTVAGFYVMAYPRPGVCPKCGRTERVFYQCAGCKAVRCAECVRGHCDEDAVAKGVGDVATDDRS